MNSYTKVERKQFLRMKGNKKTKRGFTLIELLVVIAIIAILSVVVILTLNPAELLRQSRDSNRVSDLSVTKSAIAFYLASVSTPVITTTTAGMCYQDVSVAGNGTTTAHCATFFQTAASSSYNNLRTVDSTGWIPINFNSITAGGSPLAQLPADPVNNDGVHFYAYIASSSALQFKLDAHMESVKYSASGTNDVVSTDGGIDPTSYEVGTNLQL
jgi:prepilin-type N-terminal cleavage/methylation domain-containing protein